MSAWLGMFWPSRSSRTNRSGALAPAGREPPRRRRVAGEAARQAGNLLERLYTVYHGDASGLDQLRTGGDRRVPGPDFTLNRRPVAARKQEENSSGQPDAGGLDADPQAAGSARRQGVFRDKLAAGRCAPERRAHPLLDREKSRRKLSWASRSGVERSCSGHLAFRQLRRAGIPWSSRARGVVLAQPFLLSVAVDREKVDGWPSSAPRDGMIMAESNCRRGSENTSCWSFSAAACRTCTARATPSSAHRGGQDPDRCRLRDAETKARFLAEARMAQHLPRQHSEHLRFWADESGAPSW